jgi:hypothetical protein
MRIMKSLSKSIYAAFVAVAASLPLTVSVGLAADAPPPEHKQIGYTDTPLQPNGKWHVHDSNRARPTVITPGDASNDSKAGKPPSDAVVLLGAGKDLSLWQHTDGTAPTWNMKNGVLQSGKGFLQTKQTFSDFQLHVEWASPKKVEGESQGRGNSGVFLLGKFEIQVLDSFNNETYADGQASAMYGQYPPLVNACRPPGKWQTYDIVFKAPRFKGEKLESPAMVTVLHNGVVTHAGTAYFGPSSHKANPPYKPDNASGPIVLQDHGNPVSFRNIWIRPLKNYDEP